MLFELPDGTFGLLDFNYNSKINFALEPPGLTFLKERHRKSPVVLSFICLSHPDLDHIKGVEQVIKWIEDNSIRVDRVWMYPGVNERNLQKVLTRIIIELNKIATQNKSGKRLRPPGYRTISEIKLIKKGLKAIWDFAERRKINIDLLQGVVKLENLARGDVEVCLLAPLSKHIDSSNQSTLRNLFLWTMGLRKNVKAQGNLVSSVIKMRYGQQQLICGGDAGNRVLCDCLDEFDKKHQNHEGPCYASCRVSFVKASHHGAESSSSVQLWERILSQRSRVVLSAGQNYKLKHPSRETIGHINQATRNLGVTTELLTTNLCDRCLNQPGRLTEHFSWFPTEPRRSNKEESNLAASKEAPISAHPFKQSQTLHTQRATLSFTPPVLTGKRSKKARSLAAYILTFAPHRTQPTVKYATMPATEPRHCFFGGRREQIFPDCAKPIRSKSGS